MSRTWLVVLACGALVAGCGRAERETPDVPAAATPAIARTAIAFQTDWLPEPEHGGFYQALARGFYADAGLNVTLVPGGPRAMVLQKVALGQMPLGVWKSDDVTVAVAQGLPLVCLAAVFQRDPQALMFHAEHPVRDFRDLEGRPVMAGVASVWVKLIERREGIKIQLLPLSFSIAQFMEEPRLVQQCLVTSEPYHAQKAGAKVGTLLVAASGQEPYPVIFANRAWLAANPAAAHAFVRASLRGWRDFLEGDPTPAFAAIARVNPQHDTGSMGFSRDAMIAQHLVIGDRPGERLGRIDPARLARQAKMLHEFGLTARLVPPGELIAPGFDGED